MAVRLIDMAVHGLSFLQWMAGEGKAVRVVAEAGTFVHPQEVEDTSVILVRFDNGMIGQTEDSWSLVGGFDSRFEVFGTKGHAMVDLDAYPTALLWDKQKKVGSTRSISTPSTIILSAWGFSRC